MKNKLPIKNTFKPDEALFQMLEYVGITIEEITTQIDLTLQNLGMWGNKDEAEENIKIYNKYADDKSNHGTIQVSFTFHPESRFINYKTISHAEYEGSSLEHVWIRGDDKQLNSRDSKKAKNVSAQKARQLHKELLRIDPLYKEKRDNTPKRGIKYGK